jgi:hypothetical protein
MHDEPDGCANGRAERPGGKADWPSPCHAAMSRNGLPRNPLADKIQNSTGGQAPFPPGGGQETFRFRLLSELHTSISRIINYSIVVFRIIPLTSLNRRGKTQKSPVPRARMHRGRNWSLDLLKYSIGPTYALFVFGKRSAVNRMWTNT